MATKKTTIGFRQATGTLPLSLPPVLVAAALRELQAHRNPTDPMARDEWGSYVPQRNFNLIEAEFRPYSADTI